MRHPLAIQRGERSSRACERFSRPTIIELLDTGYVGLPGAPPSPRVLVVEDDVETRQFYAHVLQSVGFQIDQAHNGLQAFEKAVLDVPDLILTDIAVPGIDGIELCRRLRADERTHRVPLLAITGYGDRQYEDRARSAGADDVLSKPCSADMLAAEALRVLARATNLRDRSPAPVVHKGV